MCIYKYSYTKHLYICIYCIYEYSGKEAVVLGTLEVEVCPKCAAWSLSTDTCKHPKDRPNLGSGKVGSIAAGCRAKGVRLVDPSVLGLGKAQGLGSWVYGVSSGFASIGLSGLYKVTTDGHITSFGIYTLIPYRSPHM